MVCKEVGKGTFGKVFRCEDTKHKDTVAIKIIRSIPRYIDSAKIEARVLDHIYDEQKKRRLSHVVKLFASFECGRHYMLVCESLGLSLYDFMKMNDHRGFPLRLVRDVCRQLLQDVSFLRSMNLIHTGQSVSERESVGGSLPISERVN